MATTEETMNLTEKEVERSKEYGLEEELAAIDRMIGRNLSHRQQNWTKYPGLPAPSLDEPIRIMLLGKDGPGKSALGNVLLGEERFESWLSAAPITYRCQEEQGKYGDQEIIVIDTPSFVGYRETYGSIGENHNAWEEIESYRKNNIHVFMLVINNGYRQCRSIGIKELKAMHVLNRESSNRFMLVSTHSGACYSENGTDDLLADLQDDLKAKTFFKAINDRVVMVELGEEPLTQNSALRGTAVYEKERKQARDMVMSMVGKVLDDSRKSGLHRCSGHILWPSVIMLSASGILGIGVTWVILGTLYRKFFGNN